MDLPLDSWNGTPCIGFVGFAPPFGALIALGRFVHWERTHCPDSPQCPWLPQSA